MEFDFLEQEARRLHEGGVIHGIRQASADAPVAADVGPAGTR